MSLHRLISSIPRVASATTKAAWSKANPAAAIPILNARNLSTDSNITYSGGQATEGQGGYYGSGGARRTNTPPPQHQWQRPEMLALAADVTKMTSLMKEVETLEQLLQTENEKVEGCGDAIPITGKTIEIKSRIKKLCTQPEIIECLNRLELNGEPVWGLSSVERDLIITVRSKVNEC
jgi:hypothetical protein